MWDGHGLCEAQHADCRKDCHAAIAVSAVAGEAAQCAEGARTEIVSDAEPPAGTPGRHRKSMCLPHSLPASSSLEQRKEQWRQEEEEKRKNTPDPSIPAGHTLMSEKERQETLQSLKESMLLSLNSFAVLSCRFVGLH